MRTRPRCPRGGWGRPLREGWDARATGPRARRAGRFWPRRAPRPTPLPRPTRDPPSPAPATRAPVRSGATVPGHRAASAAGDGRSRRRLVDPEGPAELAPDRLRLRARRIGPEHDAVAVVGILGLEPARAQPGPRELLRHLRRPGPGLA